VEEMEEALGVIGKTLTKKEEKYLENLC